MIYDSVHSKPSYDFRGGYAMVVDEHSRQRSRDRAKRRAQRLLARQTGKNVVVEIVDELIKEGAPDWFTSEQATAWLDELMGQRRRIVGPPRRF